MYTYLHVYLHLYNEKQQAYWDLIIFNPISKLCGCKDVVTCGLENYPFPSHIFIMDSFNVCLNYSHEHIVNMKKDQ